MSRKQYPKCCIFVIGDNNQLSPIADIIEETYIDEDTGREIPVPEELCDRVRGTPIYDVDYCFELNRNYRQKNDPELRKLLKNIKGGIIAPNDLYRFFKEHACNYQELFAICRTNAGIYSWEDTDLEGIYRAKMNTKVISNSQLFSKEGVNLDSGEQINIEANLYYLNKKGDLKESLKPVKGVTCHRVQGATFKEEILQGQKVVIDVDDALSIVKDTTNKIMIEDFLRFLYVAFSRFESSEQITVKFSKKNIQKLTEVSAHAFKLDSRIKPDEELSSKEFCDKVNPMYLAECLDKTKVYTNSGKLAYIYNNNNIYANLGEKVYTFMLSKKLDAYTAALLAYNAGYSRNNKHGISKFLMDIGANRHKVSGALDLIFDYIDMLSDMEKEETKDTTGKTIGEIEEENKIVDSLDELVEIEIQKCRKEKDKDMFRKCWASNPTISKYEFIKELIAKFYTN